MNICYFDTETTGLINFEQSIIHESQPRLVQLAALTTDEQGNEISHFKLRICPAGFDIPEQASKVHGITTELASKTGIPIKAALRIFHVFCQNAHRLVAFNANFDRFIIDREHILFSGTEKPEDFFLQDIECAMKAMTEVCQIPSPHYPGKFKWPKLQEAYRHLFNEKFEGAHDALADVRATARVHRWLMEHGKMAGPFPPNSPMKAA